MGKIKRVLQKMSLKKSLVLVAVCSLSFVSILSVITIVTCSDIRQRILDTRPIVVTDYVAHHTEREPEEGFTVVPNAYTYGKLSKENQVNYWIATVLMAALPILSIIGSSIVVAKFYYKVKLQIPLTQLKTGIYHIAQQDLDFQISYTSDDELGKLCDAFAQMKDEIYKSNCNMWEMLQERKALTASVSHDLRTPITVLNGYLDYLEKAMERKILTEELLQVTIRNMAGAVNRLERYVDCVKDIQRMEEIEIRKEPCALKELLTSMASEFSLLAKQQGRQFFVQDFTKTALVQTDQEMLRKILENVFDNALRFSKEKIILSVEEGKEEISFSVRDDGSGFTAEELHSATSLFYRSSVHGGNFGIGLSICSILCEKLGGMLCLGNHPDGGANVTINIKKEP